MFYNTLLVNSASILFSFNESTLPGKVIVLLLIVFSIFAWTIMISKWLEISRAQRETLRFVKAYRNEKHPAALFLKRRRFDESPVYRIYERCCIALGGELESSGIDPDELFLGGLGDEGQHIGALQLDAIRNLNERNVADQAILLENNMGFLATAVSVSPFLGLLGTVWGVMDAFGGMAVTGAATLASVAPGIAGALLTTIIGLIVALPSAVGYNLLTNRIRRLCVEMDNYAQELSADVQRAFHTE